MISIFERHDTADSAAAVVAHVRELIDRGALGPGARLPPERDLALQVGVSRPTVRAGLRTLAALGVIRSRRGSGTYIPEGPPTLGSEALSFLAALHKFTADDVYEARRILEVGAAGLAAERATPDHLATLADEVAGLFASLAERQVFLVHDINFHRGIAAASGNPIVASLVEMVSALYYERRRATAERAVDRDLRDAADAHRQIYQAIRARDVDRARRTMNDHLLRARSYQAKEQLLQASAHNPQVSTAAAPRAAATAQRSAAAARRSTATAQRSTLKAPRARRAAR
jgi:GntR family transcriptional repressor for pyruvate dehydrogenase complex